MSLALPWQPIMNYSYCVQFDDMHEKIKKTLLGEIAVYRPKSDKEKWADYQAGMIEHLDEARKEVMESSEELMSTFVIDRMASLQGTVNLITLHTVLHNCPQHCVHM